jgi:hypothetical protein
MLHTPLEQFQIIILFSIKLFCFDFSITNFSVGKTVVFKTKAQEFKFLFS